MNIESPYARIVDTPAILRTLLVISMVGSLGIGIVFSIARGFDETFISLSGASLTCVILLLFHNKGFHTASGVGLFIVISLVLTYNISIGHAIYDEAMLAYPLLIVFSGLVFGKRTITVVTLITLVQMAMIYLLAAEGKVRPFDGAIPVGLEETITTSVILGATGFLVWVVVDLIESAVLKISQAEQSLEQAYDLTLEAWAKALELREREIPGHNERVTELSIQFARHLALDPQSIQGIKQGALLHDIGKMGIPEDVLLKPKLLSSGERKMVRTHTQLGEKIISEIDYLQGALEIVSCHHERYDGRGYPDQLKHTEIPISAQLFSIVDCWDVLRHSRPCRASWSDERVLEFLQAEKGGKFNPSLVDDFIAFLGLKQVSKGGEDV